MSNNTLNDLVNSYLSNPCSCINFYSLSDSRHEICFDNPLQVLKANAKKTAILPRAEVWYAYYDLADLSNDFIGQIGIPLTVLRTLGHESELEEMTLFLHPTEKGLDVYTKTDSI